MFDLVKTPTSRVYTEAITVILSSTLCPDRTRLVMDARGMDFVFQGKIEDNKDGV